MEESAVTTRAANYYVLLYHALDAEDEPSGAENEADLSVVVGQTDFRNQMRCLSKLGLSVVSVAQMIGNPGCAESGERVVLTFDDGHRSNWSLAVPVLLEAKYTAMFYVVAGHVDVRPDYLTSSQLREMAQQGMEIGSHTMTHRFLPQLSAGEIRYELEESRARLEEITERPVLDLAIPGGHYNSQVIAEAQRLGYRSVATCKVGIYRTGQDPMQIPRLEIRRNLTMDRFRDTFQRGTVRRLQAIEFAKACLRRTLGLKTYTDLRRVAHRLVSINR